jgi:hypothetical protein
MMAVSQIGKRVCRVNLRGRDILIAIKVHLDSSGKSTVDQFITLAGFAAPDELWANFENEWSQIMTNHSPKSAYVHMKEINSLTKGFEPRFGWNHQNAFGLAGACLAYMSRLDKERFRMFYCTVDIGAWRKLKGEGYELPEPIEMCNEFCVYGVQLWYAYKFPLKTEIFDLATDGEHYIFDRNEEFYLPFRAKWNVEKDKFESTGELSPWILIDDVTEADMKKVPGIQAADILAWSVNREHMAPEGYPGKMYLEIMKKVIPSGFVFWDEDKMRKRYGVIEQP